MVWVFRLFGEWALVKLVDSLINLVNVFIGSEVSEFGVSRGFDSNLGSSEVSVSGPHAFMSIAMNSCLKSNKIPHHRIVLLLLLLLCRAVWCDGWESLCHTNPGMWDPAGFQHVGLGV